MSAGTPAPLTQEQVDALVKGVAIPDLETLLASHPGFVKPPDLGPLAGAAPVPLDGDLLAELTAGTLSDEELAKLFPSQAGEAHGEVPEPTGQAPVPLTLEELKEAAAGTTPAKLAGLLEEVASQAPVPDLAALTGDGPSGVGPLDDLLC
ncbi:MAG: hypothetical protein M3323_10660 [Actinomycetota bacterium]|nr:hypothetical protein [Actinomycetota bacterium]